MQPEELMLHDWYRWYAEGTYYTFQVKPEDFVKNYVANFEPVPLSTEILNKNDLKVGYNVLSEYASVRIDWFRETDNSVVQNVENPTVWNVHVIYEEGNIQEHCDVTVKVRYVHELQHVFRVCKLHDRANNFKI